MILPAIIGYDKCTIILQQYIQISCSLKREKIIFWMIYLLSKQQSSDFSPFSSKNYCVHSFWSQNTEKRNTALSQMWLGSVFKMRMSILNTATTEQMGQGSISFFDCFPLMNQIVITSPFCQIKKVAEIQCFFTAILYILYGSIFMFMFNW